MLIWCKKHRWQILLILVFSTVFIWWHLVSASSNILKFAMLDIGQGDALYIEAPNGRSIMFDGGPNSNVLSRLGEVMKFTDHSIDMIVITNPDKDHIAGFSDVLDKYNVGAVLEPGTTNPSDVYKNLEKKIHDKHIPDILVKQGMKIMLDERDNVYIDILFPDRDVSTWTTNDGSVVARLVYGKDSVMLTGDATRTTENILLDEKINLKSTILKVGHHGSHTSTGAEFVQAVAPQYAVISDGKGNSYGHPHIETLNTLNQEKVKILRTDLLGTILFEMDGEILKLK